MQTVGIIGGLGPETTSEFYLDIVFSCQKKPGKQRPRILISSVPAPYEVEQDLITKNTGTERYIPFLVDEAKRLQKAGADFLVMPCNSLHLYINEIRKAVTIPVLSIIEETVRFLKKEKYKRVGIVSTATTMENRLYEIQFEKQHIETIRPDDYKQAKMGKIILNLVRGFQNNKDRQELIDVINDFEKNKVDCVVLACTDLQLLIPSHPTLKIFDTMKILADATVREINQKTPIMIPSN